MAVPELVRLLLALVLAGAAVAKLAGGAAARDSLAAFGIASPRARAAAWAAVAGIELALALALVTGIEAAAPAAAAVFAAFALALAWAIARGRAGAPCGCFGARSRIGRAAVARAAGLFVLAASVPFLPETRPSAQGWLAAGLVVALAGVAALAVAVLALAREVGELRLSLGPQAALSIAGEGPELGARIPLIERFEPRPRLALAVFTSDGCGLCRRLEPAIELVGREPGVAVRTFEEHADAHVWRELRIPGSPFAVVMADDGTVLSSGTFNTLAQLEGLLAAGERDVGALARA